MFRQWSLVAGPVFTIQLGARNWVILNSIQAVHDLIVKRGTIYSSRDMPDVLIHEIMDGDNGGAFAFYPYGAHWRKLRQVAHSGLTKKKIGEYQPIMDQGRTTLVHNVLAAKAAAEPGAALELTPILEHYTMTSILTIVFGDLCRFQPGDPRLHEGFALTENISNVFGPVQQAAEFFPWIKFLIPSNKERNARIRAQLVAFYGGIIKEFRQMLENGQAQDCFIKPLMEHGELSDVQLMDFIAVFTTASTLNWMIALLANHPEVQDRVYQEIKDAVGLDRLPDAEDEPQLPFLQCVLYETLRLRAPAPLSVPHATSEDDVYNNWFIPKKTTVIVNLHAIHYDPALFPDPTAFKPERHWDHVMQTPYSADKGISQSVSDRPHLSFSTGRRVCVGIHLAERNLFMGASALLAQFRFERESDALINVVDAKDPHAPTFLPRPYKVRVVERKELEQNYLSI
ncbi:cytochrome P450 [Gongronella butleri]|nr:cytochrome P450 [Gongronella butleri]